jgi:hypothetical protein
LSAKLLADGVATLLATDPTFQAALTTLLGFPVTRVLRSNIPWDQIPTDQWPCFILEHGPGASGSITNSGDDTDGLTIGATRQGFGSELDVALLWAQADRETAFDQRSQLPTLFAQLFMRNPEPGGVPCYLQNWVPDQGINHPKHIWNATLSAAYAIRRS